MHNSKKITKFFSKLSVIIGCTLIFSLCGNLLYNECEKNNYDGCYEFKLNLLKESKDVHKAVFIGGSATNFGLHADLFEEETGIRAINMGFSAGRSFKSYLDSVRPYLIEGDYLFMCPEIGYYNSDFFSMDESTAMFYLYNNRELIFKDSLIVNLLFVSETVKIGWEGWINSLSQISKEIISKLLGKHLTIYNEYECNNNGDFILHKTVGEHEFSAEIENLELVSDNFLIKLNEYSSELKISGISPILIFPPKDTNSVININQARVFSEKVKSKLNIETLFYLDETIYPHEYFLDTVNHLKFDKGIEYTRFIIDRFLSLSN